MCRYLASYILLSAILWVSPFRGLGLLAQEVQQWSGFGIEANPIAGKVIKHEKKIHPAYPGTDNRS